MGIFRLMRSYFNTFRVCSHDSIGFIWGSEPVDPQVRPCLIINETDCELDHMPTGCLCRTCTNIFIFIFAQKYVQFCARLFAKKIKNKKIADSCKTAINEHEVIASVVSEK